jgi:hypothetical protein
VAYHRALPSRGGETRGPDSGVYHGGFSDATGRSPISSPRRSPSSSLPQLPNKSLLQLPNAVATIRYRVVDLVDFAATMGRYSRGAGVQPSLPITFLPFSTWPGALGWQRRAVQRRQSERVCGGLPAPFTPALTLLTEV